MAPSTPRFSFHCDTGCECVHARPRQSESQSQSPSQNVNVHLTCLYIACPRDWQVARPLKVGPEGFSGSSCRLKLQHHGEPAKVR